MVQEWYRRIGAHLQRTTVHHPATPTVENLGMARWYRSGIEELEPIYSAQQVYHPATPTVEDLAAWSRSGIEELEPIYSAQQVLYTIQPHLQLKILGWLHGPGVG